MNDQIEKLARAIHQFKQNFYTKEWETTFDNFDRLGITQKKFYRELAEFLLSPDIDIGKLKNKQKVRL